MTLRVSAEPTTSTISIDAAPVTMAATTGVHTGISPLETSSALVGTTRTPEPHYDFLSPCGRVTRAISAVAARTAYYPADRVDEDERIQRDLRAEYLKDLSGKMLLSTANDGTSDMKFRTDGLYSRGKKYHTWNINGVLTRRTFAKICRSMQRLTGAKRIMMAHGFETMANLGDWATSAEIYRLVDPKSPEWATKPAKMGNPYGIPISAGILDRTFDDTPYMANDILLWDADHVLFRELEGGPLVQSVTQQPGSFVMTAQTTRWVGIADDTDRAAVFLLRGVTGLASTS